MSSFLSPFYQSDISPPLTVCCVLTDVHLLLMLNCIAKILIICWVVYYTDWNFKFSCN